MKFCNQCAAPVIAKIPPGDNRVRFVCESCQTIHYQNPKLVAGCLPVWQDRILLCKRAIEPRYGLWTLPAGFMENHETTEQAAMRETWEEAEAKVVNLQLYTVFSLPHISQVYFMFRAELPEPKFAPGSESLEVALFSEAEIPWDNIAFPVIRQTLSQYFSDKVSNYFPVHVANVIKPLKDQCIHSTS